MCSHIRATQPLPAWPDQLPDLQHSRAAALSRTVERAAILRAHRLLISSVVAPCFLPSEERGKPCGHNTHVSSFGSI